MESKKITLSAESYAKVNLFLHVLGKRADGYHDIYTLFCAVDLCDTLSVSFADSTHIICDRPDIPVNEDNIILKVDKILREEYSLEPHFKIELHKVIPVGAGLGGGSGNAATYLQLVNRLAGMGLSRLEMHKILERVGSDTPFFLYTPMALGEGRGERITPLETAPKLWILIVNPNIFISTAAVYAGKKLRLTSEDLLPKIPNSLNAEEIVKMMTNDLEPAVFDGYPLTAELCGALGNAGALKAMVSGSGSSVFAVFRDKKGRDAAYDTIYKRYPDYMIVKTASLDKV